MTENSFEYCIDAENISSAFLAQGLLVRSEKNIRIFKAAVGLFHFSCTCTSIHWKIIISARTIFLKPNEVCYMYDSCKKDIWNSVFEKTVEWRLSKTGAKPTELFVLN